jgi:hypothetical protein
MIHSHQLIIITRFTIGSYFVEIAPEQIGSGNVPTLIFLTMLAEAIVSIFAIKLTQDLMLQMWSH